MSLETFGALLLLAAAGCWTPGPNNLMLAASGANFGIWRTVPHILGVALGFPVMIFAVAFGLGEVFQSSALAREIMRWLGAALLLWFAWRIATAGRAESRARARPLSLIEAAGFQWINPKSWAMALATGAQFVTGANPLLESSLCALAYALVGLGSASVWSGFGVGIKRFLKIDARLRAFNLIMGALIASFVLFLFRDAF